jgi:hypothetical protein
LKGRDFSHATNITQRKRKTIHAAKPRSNPKAFPRRHAHPQASVHDKAIWHDPPTPECPANF